MADISKITLPNGKEYDLKDTTARNAANSAVPNTRTVNGKALSSNISLGAGDVGAYTKSETDTKINAAIASAYKYKGSVTADKLPTSGQVVGDVYNITNDSSYGKAGMNVAWTGTTWDALGSNVDLSNYVTTSDSRLSNARPASDVYAWAKAENKPTYTASEVGAQPSGYYTTASLIGTSTPDITVDDIFKLRKGTTGGVGSVNIKQKSSGLGSEIPTGWYNYIYSPHRTGIGGDNDRYATVILCPMTFSGESYILRYSSDVLAECRAFGLLSAADKKALDREFFRMLPKGGTHIPPNADLNTVQYIKIGNYYNSSTAETQTMKNCPGGAFIMYVLSPLSEAYDNESTAPWVYRLRIFVEHTGKFIFTQTVYSWNTAGSFTYDPWVKITNSNDLGAVSKLINDHIANKSNPHGVTKAQVGLGNVDNTADSAKSVKYATSAGSANSVAWGNVSGKPSTYTPSAHTHTSIESVQLTNQDLNDYKSNSVQFLYGAGSNTVANKPSGVDVFGVYTYRSAYGFYTQELVDANGTKYLRICNSTSWTAWKTIVDSSNVAGYKVNNAGYADSAGKATNDSAGQNINTTYIKSLSVSGRTITYTKGNGATGTITTQDTNTTYGVATSSADGLMSKSDKAKLDGIGTGSNVKSVNGKTGAVTLAKGDVGLGNVDNVSKSSILQSVYPAGAIYMSMSSTSPATLFGGTWEQIKDTFLLGAGDSYTAGSTGGEATHTLTVNEMPSHSHEVKAQSAVKDSEYGVFSHNINGGSSISIYSMEQTHETGGGASHNNMPPYLTVYMWKRIA